MEKRVQYKFEYLAKVLMIVSEFGKMVFIRKILFGMKLNLPSSKKETRITKYDTFSYCISNNLFSSRVYKSIENNFCINILSLNISRIRPFPAVNKTKMSVQCEICFNSIDFYGNRRLLANKCGHTFHGDCLSAWYKSG